MTHRIVNFNPGPCALPLPALQAAQAEFLDFQGTGMSIVETSHRSKEYAAVHAEAKSLIKELAGLDDEWEVLFLQGGASMQFCMVPYNLLGDGRKASFVNTGIWSKKAIKEAKFFGDVQIAGSSEDDAFKYVPKFADLDIDEGASYLHLTSNNTIYGTEWADIPATSPVPLVCDMSSDFFARTFPTSAADIIYAGAQKNAGPAGVTVVLFRKSVLERCQTNIPTMLQYKTQVAKDSLFNTGPVFGIYMVRNVMLWLKEFGGLEAIEAQNRKKAELLYGVLDKYSEVITPHARPDSRSLMNVTFRLQNAEQEARLIAEGLANGFSGLKGHRSVGGIRVSMYNAISVANIESFCGFLEDFVQKL